MLKEQATAAAQRFLDSDCVCTAKRNVSPWWPLVGRLSYTTWLGLCLSSTRWLADVHVDYGCADALIDSRASSYRRIAHLGVLGVQRRWGRGCRIGRAFARINPPLQQKQDNGHYNNGYEPLIVAAKPVHLAPRLPLQVCPWQNRKSTKYTSSTEMNWNGTDLLARYKAVGIELVENAKIGWRRDQICESSNEKRAHGGTCRDLTSDRNRCTLRSDGVFGPQVRLTTASSFTV